MNSRLVATIALTTASAFLSACAGAGDRGGGALPSSASQLHQMAASVTSTALGWHAGGSRAGMPNSSNDVARADNGDRVLVQGSGTFNGCFPSFGANCTVSGGRITGGGKYTIENAAGAIRGHGTFSVVSPFTSFIGFGPPAAGSPAEGGRSLPAFFYIAFREAQSRRY